MTEVMGADPFKVAVLASWDRASLAFFDRWLSSNRLRSRVPLILVREDDFRDRLPPDMVLEDADAFDLEKGRIFVAETNSFPCVADDPATVLLCSTTACVPGSFEETKWGLDERTMSELRSLIGSDNWLGMDEIRQTLREQPEFAEHIQEQIRRRPRRAIETLPPTQRQEALAILAWWFGPRTLAVDVNELQARFHADCSLRSPSLCFYSTHVEASRVMEYAQRPWRNHVAVLQLQASALLQRYQWSCTHGEQVACTESVRFARAMQTKLGLSDEDLAQITTEACEHGADASCPSEDEAPTMDTPH
ncbi:MAG: hypothetical protein KTR31_37860 [Myxococcales bacterium]|nr:hypothetical protein [Myxococcales bacterium]